MKESRFWFLFLIAGLVLFLLLGYHIVFIHLLGNYEANISFQSVASRSVSPAYAVFYLLFLVFALYHGFYGLRTILLEIEALARHHRTVTAILVVLGVGLFVYGTWALFAAMKIGAVG